MLSFLALFEFAQRYWILDSDDSRYWILRYWMQDLNGLTHELILSVAYCPLLIGHCLLPS